MEDKAGSLKEVIDQLKDATASLEARRTLRDANVSLTTRPTEDILKKLDSSMKRNTALIRKLKQLNEDNSKSLLDDIAKTNQSKYVSEAVQAVAEAPLKLKDIPAAVKIASALHQRYPEFSKELVPSLAKIFSPSGSSNTSTEDEKPTPARKRATLRFLVDLFLYGVFTSHSGLLAIVRQLANTGASNLNTNRDEALVALSLMTAFVKAGREEILGLPHNDPAALPADLNARAAAGEETEAVECAAAIDVYNTELEQRWSLAPEPQALFRDAAEKLLEATIAVLQSSYEALIKREKDNDRILQSRGDLPESLITKYETQRFAFEGLERSAAALAEALERQLPEFKISAPEDEGPPIDDSGPVSGSGDAVNSPFEDEESRIFYQSLPNLREIVPAVLLKGAVEPVAPSGTDGGEGESAGKEGEILSGEMQPTEEEEVDDDDDDDLDIEAAIAKLEIQGEEDIEKERNEDVDQQPGGDNVAVEDGDREQKEEDAEDNVEQVADAIRKEIEEQVEKDGKEESSATTENSTSTSTRGALNSILERLPHCVSKDLSDEAAVEFCYAGGAGKGARKKLALELTHVPLGALQLIPYYARIAAVLAPLFPDVAETVVKVLEGEFRGLSRKKDATNRILEPRLRNARYIGEMVKFRLFPAGTAFRLLKSLFSDFSGHNVDAACALVETAGRYLLRRPDTAQRMTNMLEIMMRLKTVKNMDPRLAGLVDYTYHVVKSTAQGPKIKERPPIHEWIRYLIYTRLDASSVPFVLKKLRRIHWKDGNSSSTNEYTNSDDEEYVLRTLLRAVRKGRYSQLKPLASLTAGLSRWHPSIVSNLIDAVLEEIIAGMENPEAALYQRRVAVVRFLGELYSYRVVTAGLIFDTLHTLLSYGHSADVPSDVTRRLDPPHNFFRLRLVCALIESCGSKKLLSQKGVSKSSRFNNFLPYLQRYILSKPPLALDIDLDVQEMYSRLEITPPEFESYEAACAAVAKIESAAAVAAAAAAAAGLEIIEEEEEEEDEEHDSEMEEDERHLEYDSEGQLIAHSGSDDEGDDSGSDSGSGNSSSSEGSSSESDSDSDSEDSDSDEDEIDIEKTEAEEEFERELLAAMGGGDVGGGGGGGATGGPSNSMKMAASPAAIASTSSAPPSVHSQQHKQPSETMALRVMVRKGARNDKSQELLIPVPLTAANKLREKEAAEAAERAEMKRMVLAANRRDELETVHAAAAALATRGGRGGGHFRGGGAGGRGGGATRY